MRNKRVIDQGDGEKKGRPSDKRRQAPEKQPVAQQVIGDLAMFPDENPNPVMRVSGDNIILYANLASAGLLKSWKTRMGGALPNHIYGEVDSAWISSENRDLEVEWDGKFFLFLIVPLIDRGYANIYGRDITDRKRAEEALRESERRFRTLFENMLEGLAYCRIIYDGRGRPVDWVYLDVNNAFERLTGLTDIVGKRATEAIPGIREATPDLFEIYGRVAATGAPERFEINFTPLSSWLNVSVYSPSKGSFVAVFEDITERKYAEQALRQAKDELEYKVSERTAELRAIEERLRRQNEDLQATEEELRLQNEEIRKANEKLLKSEDALRKGEQRFKSLFENMINGFVLYEVISDAMGEAIDALYLDVNPAFERMMGLKREDVIGKTVTEVFPKIDRESFKVYWEISRGGKPVIAERFRYDTGQYFESTIYNPAPGQVAVVFQDITERKQAEEAVRRSEKHYRTLFEQMLSGFALHEIITDQEGKPIDYRFLEVNPVFEKLTGLTADKVIGRTVREIIPDIEFFWIERYGRVALTGEPIQFEEFSGPLGKFYEARAFSPEPGKFAVAFNDITERKRTEEALQASEANLREAQRIASLGSWDWNIRTNELRWSDEIYRIFGLTPQQFGATYDAFLASVHPDDRGAVIKAVDAAVKEGAPYGIEHRAIRPDGTKRIVYERGEVTFSETGEPIRMVGTVQDITERKRAQEALEESEARYRALFNNMSNSLCVHEIIRDADGNVIDTVFVEANPAFEKALGIRPEAVIGQKASAIFTESGRRWPELCNRVAQTGEPAVTEQYVGSVGKLFELAIYKSGPDRVAVYRKDITMQRKIEIALRDSEQKFRGLFETITDGVARVDLDGYIVENNPAFGRMLGYTEEELRHLTIYDVTPSRWHHQQDEIKAQLLSRGQSDSYEKEYIRKDGTIFPVTARAWAILDSEGKPVGAWGIARDITARKRRDEALREIQERLELALIGGDLGLWDWDERSGRVVVNERYAGMLGYTLAELEPVTYATWEERLHPDDKERTIKTLMDHVEGKTGYYESEFRLRKKNGTWVWILDRGRAIERDANGRALRLVGTHMDITEHKEAEFLLEHKMAELTRANEELQRFAYVASHDLQEPLRMISSYMQLLEMRYGDKLDKDASEFIDYAVSGARRLQNMIQSLLEYSRVHTRANPFESVSMEDIVADAEESLEFAIGDTGAVITHDELPQVVGDRVQLSRLLQNLISNAIKFRGERKPEIHVSAKYKDGQWLFGVRDNGIGIDPKYHEKIFIIFQRLHGHEYEGTGIGLSVSKRIVERHGGMMCLDSELDKGSTFYFTLPAGDFNYPREEV